MKVAVAVAECLRDAGIRHVYTVSGGADLHIIHAIHNTEGITYVPNQTEQGSSFAADACARINGIGCALATSGPGFTNLLTGLASSYYDSVPVIFVVGQVTTFRRANQFYVGNNGVSGLDRANTSKHLFSLDARNAQTPRQYGFQETPVTIAQEICKYVTEPSKKEEVIPELRKAISIARTPRMGPVLISIPDDVQRAEL